MLGKAEPYTEPGSAGELQAVPAFCHCGSSILPESDGSSLGSWVDEYDSVSPEGC